MQRHTARPSSRTSGFLEWDDTPSFAEVLPHLLSWKGRVPNAADPSHGHYAETMPAALLPASAQSPTTFREPVSGLAVREVMDLDVFQHFFGAGAR